MYVDMSMHKITTIKNTSSLMNCDENTLFQSLKQDSFFTYLTITLSLCNFYFDLSPKYKNTKDIGALRINIFV